jgi:hypothetical protein
MGVAGAKAACLEGGVSSPEARRDRALILVIKGKEERIK